MSFSVGIVGLPNIGKSTLFKALTKNKVDVAAYPFTTIHPNVGVVQVPDERLEKIAEIIKPEKITPTIIEFVDIAGLVKNAHKGEGLGNQFLAQIRNCDAILEVVRVFEDPRVEHVAGPINPQRDIEIVKIELLMKDLETLENLLKKMEKDIKTRNKPAIKKEATLKKIKEEVSRATLISEIDLSEEEKSEIKEYQFLTQKPIFYILNTKALTEGEESSFNLGVKYLTLNLKEEADLSELSELEFDEDKSSSHPFAAARELKELEIKSKLDQLILNCYNLLDLITFFTVAGLKETRAWTLKKGLKAPEAGTTVHTDFKEKFIRAEVINWQKLIEAGNWHKAREMGWLKTVGRDYIVQDGDIIEFKI